MSKSTADLVNWRQQYVGPEQSQENLDFWNMLRKRSIDAQSIIGLMPGVFQPNALVGAATAQNPAPGGTMPTKAQVAEYIRPGFTGFDFSSTTPKGGSKIASASDFFSNFKNASGLGNTVSGTGNTVSGTGTTDSSFTVTPQMKTDLIAALQSLVGKAGFENLGPLLALLGKG